MNNTEKNNYVLKLYRREKIKSGGILVQDFAWICYIKYKPYIICWKRPDVDEMLKLCKNYKVNVKVTEETKGYYRIAFEDEDDVIRLVTLLKMLMTYEFEEITSIK